jgi:hypothetical protein
MAPSKARSAREDEPLDSAQDAGGEKDDRADQLECASNSDAEDTERKQEQPDEWIGDEGQQGQGPAEKEQDAEEKKLCHGKSSIRFGAGWWLAIGRPS